MTAGLAGIVRVLNDDDAPSDADEGPVDETLPGKAPETEGQDSGPAC